MTNMTKELLVRPAPWQTPERQTPERQTQLKRQTPERQTPENKNFWNTNSIISNLKKLKSKL